MTEIEIKLIYEALSVRCDRYYAYYSLFFLIGEFREEDIRKELLKIELNADAVDFVCRITGDLIDIENYLVIIEKYGFDLKEEYQELQKGCSIVITLAKEINLGMPDLFSLN